MLDIELYTPKKQPLANFRDVPGGPTFESGWNALSGLESCLVGRRSKWFLVRQCGWDPQIGLKPPSSLTLYVLIMWISIGLVFIIEVRTTPVRTTPSEHEKILACY